jgi:ABC-type lipoprotein export system ATPase subunit
MGLRVKELRKVFPHGDGDVTLFGGLSFELASGGSLALTGPSGSGKTTLLRLLAALETPTTGEIWVNDVRVDQLDGDAARAFRLRNIGFVYQEHRLLPQLTALENVALPGVAAGEECTERSRRLLELVGLVGKASHFPEQLSGGERQRVAVARALVMCPALVLADEPTGQLDAGRATVLLELLQQLNQEQRVTIVMATHSQRARGYMREQVELG